MQQQENFSLSKITKDLNMTPKAMEKLEKLLSEYKHNVHYILCSDFTDSDNLAVGIALARAFGEAKVSLILTGRRAVRPEDSDKYSGREGMAHWDEEYSQWLLEDNIKKFYVILSKFGFDHIKIYDGGIAELVGVPHNIHSPDTALDHGVDSSKCKKEGYKLDTLNQNLLQEHLAFIIGGPATGMKLAIEENEGLKEKILWVSGQLGALGDAKLLQTDGKRGDRQQFNAMLAPLALKFCVDFCREFDVPLFINPTESTKVPELAAGVQEMLSPFLEKSFAMISYQLFQKNYTSGAVTSRNGEAIYEHDMAPLFMLLSMLGQAKEIYNIESKHISDIITQGAEKGTMDFDELYPGEQSNVVVATQMKDRYEFFRLFAELFGGRGPQKDILLSCSFKYNDEKELEERYAIILKQIIPELTKGHNIIWGSHPSLKPLMWYLNKLFPGQIKQYLLEEYAETQVVEDKDLMLCKDIIDLRVQMIQKVDEALFIMGDEEKNGVIIENLMASILKPEIERKLLIEYPGQVQAILEQELGDLYTRIGTIGAFFRNVGANHELIQYLCDDNTFTPIKKARLAYYLLKDIISNGKSYGKTIEKLYKLGILRNFFKQNLEENKLIKILAKK